MPFAFLLIDGYEVVGVSLVVAFTIFFALALNPPTKWVKKLDKSKKAEKP